MNPSDREFYPLRDPANPVSGQRTRRILKLHREVREHSPASRLTIVEPLPRTPEYQAGYAAGRRSFNACGLFLLGYLSGIVVAAGCIYFGAMLLAGW